MSEILRHHGDETVQYDVISGIGVGAINGAHLSSFEKGQEDTAADSLISLWRGLTVSQVYKSWRWGGIVRGLLFETGIYDNTPLKTYLKSHIKSPKREFYYGLVNSKTGQFVSKNHESDFNQYLLGIIGSASFPGIFPTLDELDGTTYYDGAVGRSVNIADAVNNCKKLVGGDESKVTIDIIMNSGGTFNVKDASTFKALRMGLRYLEIQLYYRSMDLLIRAKAAYPKLNFRYVVAPTNKLEGGLLPFTFDAAQIESNINKGVRDA